MKIKLNLTLAGFFLLSLGAYANTKDANHFPIGHCYHWLSEAGSQFLTYKYNYAAKNNGELTFYTTGGNGAVAGPGLYCAKTPGDSSSYGDRVIRIDLVEDIVLLDETTGTQYCGVRGDYYSTPGECQTKPWDIKFYAGGGKGNIAWYVIRNPQAVARWSANSNELMNDLNAEKPFELGGYSIQADNTINLMKAEIARMGQNTFQNPNARLSIVKILKDPSKLAQIPPLTVISLVQNYKGDDLSDSQKRLAYTQQFVRAFKDTKLGFADFTNVTKNAKDVEAAFVAELKKLDLANLGNVNPVVVLQAIDKYDGQVPMTDLKIAALWKKAILSQGDMASLVDAPLKKDGTIAKALDSSVPSRAELQKDLEAYNVVNFIKVLDLYVDSGANPVLQDSFKYLLKEIVLKGSFSSIFDKISNSKLSKESALASILLSDILTPSVIKTADPMSLGLALERAKSGLDKATFDASKAKVMNLPLQFNDKKLAYQLLEDYTQNKYPLPAFYPEVEFLSKLIDLSIKERTLSKTPTNTFRMVTTGFFGVYNDRIRKERDPKKKSSISQAAAADLFTLADSLNTRERSPFLYITVQNASYFKGNGQYKNHPIETAFGEYGTGDAGFDRAFEEAVKTSYDGSVLQFLIFQAATSPEAKQLLQLYTQTVLDPSFDQLLKDDQFIASQAEKRSWSNYINQTQYSPSNNTRVPTTVCHAASVTNKYIDMLAKSADRKTTSAMKDWADGVATGFCKSK